MACLGSVLRVAALDAFVTDVELRAVSSGDLVAVLFRTALGVEVDAQRFLYACAPGRGGRTATASSLARSSLTATPVSAATPALGLLAPFYLNTLCDLSAWPVAIAVAG